MYLWIFYIYYYISSCKALDGIFCEARMKGKKRPFSTHYDFLDIDPLQPKSSWGSFIYYVSEFFRKTNISYPLIRTLVKNFLCHKCSQ